MKHRIALAAAALGLLALPATALASAAQPSTQPAPPVAAAAPASANWQIPLVAGSAFPTATGSAQYQAQPGQRELQIEVEHLASLAGSWVRVYVNGVKIGSPKVSALGTAQLTRNSELGQSVPAIGHGSLVTVQTLTGVPVASGTF